LAAGDFEVESGEIASAGVSTGWRLTGLLCAPTEP
jgi:hypothetical protein